MSLHKSPAYNSPEMHAHMKSQGFITDEPSQLSDAFRLGWDAAMNQAAISRFAEKLNSLKEGHDR